MMLFDSTLRRDLARSFAATLIVILTIVITMFLIRTLGQAAGGAIAPQDVVLLLGYISLEHLPTILSLSLFVAVVGTLTRMYRDSEMVIWFAAGVGLLRVVGPVLRLAWPVLLVVALLALFVWPWGNRQIEELKFRYEQRSDLARITPGQFQVSSDGRRVFFVDRDAGDGDFARNVFVLERRDDGESVTSARSGRVEMDAGQRAAIAGATRVSNPGCYPTGFIGLVRPLVAAGLIPADFPITVNAISGYSGGGKGLIAEFEQPAPAGTNDAWRLYGLNMAHKHLPEMQKHGGLTHPPVFAPAVGRYAQGMIVEVPLQLWALPGKPDPSDLHAALQAFYAGERFIDVATGPECAALQKTRAGAGGYVADLDPEAVNGTNRMKLYVFGNVEGTQARLVALLDNLGKGASGAAVQNLNLMLGLEEGAGLS